MSCHVDNFDSIKLTKFEITHIWECVLKWFIMESVHERLLDICRLRSLRATYPIHVDPCVQMNPT